MDLLEKIRAASEIFAEGRKAVEEIVDAVNDGRAAVDAKTQAELDALLATERTETERAHQTLQDAIARKLA